MAGSARCLRNERINQMYMPPNSGGDFTPPPAGTHIAVCYRLIDLGTQIGEYKGERSVKRKIMLSWEIPDERTDEGKPFTISQRYTFSSHEKSALRKDLEAWRGMRFQESDFGPGGFDIKNVLGVGCMLSIIHTEKDGKTYSNISSLSKLPKGMKAPAPENDITYLSLEPGAFDRSVYEKLSDGIKQTIQKSPEWAALLGTTRYQHDDGPMATPDPSRDYERELDDPIPF